MTTAHALLALAQRVAFPPTDEPPSGVPTYGELTVEQGAVLQPFIKGRRLRDYGCGNLTLDLVLLELGAAHIEAVDIRSPLHIPEDVGKKLKFIRRRFSALKPSKRIAVVSWPYNTFTAIECVLVKAPLVIYLGRNTGGTVCGNHTFWLSMFRREVLAYVPDEHNTLIVYGKELQHRRKLKPEEYAAISPRDYVSHEHAHSKEEWDIPKRWKASL